ncbi:amino acid permease [Halorussus litoreus]|uniref:amino acid permease n=1 Tax=Halorussus litoreus TaxID=1710536 RepID=UPI000E227950|nr:amino acid permease [Halorussus litoreus]
MGKELERDLGLFAVIAISLGAMIGSGIFILPALALEIAGPAVILAYLIAGVLVLPAALSKAEMATAMPEAGGTYIYIERGMGPLLGTVAGLGTWFSLSFKGALALVGGVPYLVVLFDLPIKPVALGLAVFLIGVNLLGAKQTGRLQVGIVIAMLAALVWFVAGGSGAIQSVQYEGFFEKGAGGLFAATGLVFVSYAGVTKIASVAEEIENPSRNIPLGILGSLGFTTILYVLLVTVVVGVVPGEELSGSLTPMADAAQVALARPGVIVVVFAAILALVSTANAGLLSSSRYPFAMSRDGLMPESLSTVSQRFNTPSLAISLTGGVMLLLIAFVPILDIAKLASAFQILVFVLVNIAVVAFREGDVEGYDPAFESPLYPWTQGFGAVGGLALLTQMGWIPILSAAGITLASVAWYYVYAHGKIDREGVARDAVRRSVGRRVVEETRSTVSESNDYEVLVPVTEETTERREAALLGIAAGLVGQRDGRVRVVQFDEVPDQTPLEGASAEQSPADVAFEERTDRLAAEVDVPVEYGEIVSHDTKHAIVNFADHHDSDMMVLERNSTPLRFGLFRNDFEWIVDHAPCDVVAVGDDVVPAEEYDFDAANVIALVTDRGPYDPLKVAVADALAREGDATIQLLYPVSPEATTQRRETLADYHDELASVCSVPVESVLVESEGDRFEELTDATGTVDLVVVGDDGGRVHRTLWRRSQDRLADEAQTSTIQVHPHGSARPGLFGRLVERLAF